MLIQLSQDELKDAVRLYVTTELNINLSGKVLTTTFTATRGDAGIVTNLSIEKAGATQANSAPAAVLEIGKPTGEIKGAADVTTEAKTATLAAVAPVVASDTATTAAAVAKTEAPEAAAQEDTATAGAPAEQAEAKEEAAAPAAAATDAAPKTTSSLFG